MTVYLRKNHKPGPGRKPAPSPYFEQSRKLREIEEAGKQAEREAFYRNLELEQRANQRESK